MTPLIVPGATLYAVEDTLTDFTVGLFQLGEEEILRDFGRIGTTAGADVSCGENGREVTVSVEGEGGFEPIRLPRAAGTRYVIALDNACPPAAPPPPEAAAGQAGSAPEDCPTGTSATNVKSARVAQQDDPRGRDARRES